MGRSVTGSIRAYRRRAAGPGAGCRLLRPEYLAPSPCRSKARPPRRQAAPSTPERSRPSWQPTWRPKARISRAANGTAHSAPPPSRRGRSGVPELELVDGARPPTIGRRPRSMHRGRPRWGRWSVRPGDQSGRRVGGVDPSMIDIPSRTSSSSSVRSSAAGCCSSPSSSTTSWARSSTSTSVACRSCRCSVVRLDVRRRRAVRHAGPRRHGGRRPSSGSPSARPGWASPRASSRPSAGGGPSRSRPATSSAGRVRAGRIPAGHYGSVLVKAEGQTHEFSATASVDIPAGTTARVSRRRRCRAHRRSGRPAAGPAAPTTTTTNTAQEEGPRA